MTKIVRVKAMLKVGDFARCPCVDERGGECPAKGVVIKILSDRPKYTLASRVSDQWYEEDVFTLIPWTPDDPDELWASYCAWRLTNA
jgi:hypothetical protein